MRAILLLFIITILSGCSNAVSTDSSVPASRTLSQTAKDLKITAAIHTDLAALDLYKPINVQVRGGKVIYTGTVPTIKDDLAAVGVAWKQPGVTGVINNLVIERHKPEVSAKQYAKDNWITTTVKAKLLKEKGVKSGHYTIVTTNGVVYIFGAARSLEELNKVNSLANDIDGVRNVISHAYLNQGD